MDKTKAIVEQIECIDLAEELGELLGVNPVWEDNSVNYKLDANYATLWFDLESGCWGIFTDVCGVVRLPKEAPDLMARMSETIEEESND